jgi:hypothetical protein
MSVRRAIWLLSSLVVVLGGLWACKSADTTFWCRRDNRECFATKDECVNRKTSQQTLECFSQPQAFCFLVKSDMFSEATVQRICMPSEEECGEWRDDRRRQRPTLRIGMCSEQGPSGK